MSSIAEHPGRARRRRLALAGVLVCLGVLVQAAPAFAIPTNLSPPPAPERSGRTLTTETGSWVLAESYSYTWYRCDAAGAACFPVAGRGGPSYLLSTPDVGRRIRSLVTAFGLGSAESVFSAPSALITAAPPLNQALPTVSGDMRKGSKLSAAIGSWTDPNPSAVSYSYGWQRCAASGIDCQYIAGAAGAQYTLAAADVGAFMRVVVTAEGLGSDAVASAPIGPVLDLPATTSPNRNPTTPGPVGKLRPFPRVVLAGRLLRGRTHISRLVVTGPRGATVSVRCRGRGCASRSFRTKLGSSKRVRLRRFQRTFGAGATIEIRVTGPRAIGKFTRIRIRATRPPTRRDSCLMPGASSPSRCP